MYSVNRHGEFKGTKVATMKSLSILEFIQSFWYMTDENEDPYYPISNVLHIWLKGELISMTIGGFCSQSEKDKKKGALVWSLNLSHLKGLAFGFNCKL